jgi:soluble lytic murein transglycosylase-like protein
MFSSRKRLKDFLFSACIIISAAAFVTAATLLFPSHARADLSLIQSSIIAYNSERHKKSLSDDSYRGEEGILRVRPEVANLFGLRAYIDQDYLEAKALFQRAEELLDKTVQAMKTQKKPGFPGEHEQKVYETAFLYNKTLRSAQEHIKAYRAKLNPGADDRLNKAICSELLEKLLNECLKTASNNLRDALGCLYNICQGLDRDNAALTAENVEFVNHVFREFLEKASESAKASFDLDRNNRDHGSRGPSSGSEWKQVVGETASRYVALLERVLKAEKGPVRSVDPLLFFALIRQESDFDSRAVSDVGAVGLTQIMPRTAKDLGMKKIFMPEYLAEARSYMEHERKLRRKAMDLVQEITKEGMIEHAGRARRLMQESLDWARRWNKIYARYKQELLRENKDDRLDPAKAIEHGLRYFATMMRAQKGDLSLALAAYNAGPHRVKKYKGIPPYTETVFFRNGVLAYYRDYLNRLKKVASP